MAALNYFYLKINADLSGLSSSLLFVETHENMVLSENHLASCYSHQGSGKSQLNAWWASFWAL